MIKPSGSVILLMKWGCKGHWGHEGCWGCRGHWDRRGSKAWKITTEDFIVIQVLEFSFILIFWKKTFLLESGNIMLNFSTFFVGGCWGQPMSHFWKLVDETQMYEPPEATGHHNLLKSSILLPVRANLLCNLQCETPCSTQLLSTWHYVYLQSAKISLEHVQF